jgi:CheY-like chemotaxis protein
MLKVFLADDSQLVRDRLKEVFAEKGSIDVIGESANAVDAMQAIRRLSPDVAILDIRMPGGGGMPVLKDIKTREHSQVVIVLTSYPYPQYRQTFMAAGADYFFDKTRDIQRLCDVLVELAQQHSGVPKKRILVLGDDPAIIKIAENAIEPGRKMVTIFSSPPSFSQSQLLLDPYDLIILMLDCPNAEPAVAHMRSLFPLYGERAPLLIVSRLPFQSDADTRIHHLSIPFTARELDVLVRDILQEDPALAVASAIVPTTLSENPEMR